MTQAPGFGNQVIAASAGSGKTFQLVNRYLRLVSQGVPPDRIVALTFSRAAAREILDKLLRRLAEASVDVGKAAQVPGAGTCPGALALLRRILDRLHALRIGTLDSFLVAIVRAFPFEFGLAGDFDILDGFSGADVTRRMLRRVLRDDPQQPDGQAALVRAFRLATFGAEEKTLSPKLAEFVEAFHHVLLLAPDERMWGGAESIWQEPSPWASRIHPDPRALVESARSALGAVGLSEDQLEVLERLLSAVPALTPGIPIPRRAKEVLDKLLDVRPDLARAGAVVTLSRKKVALGPAACAALLAVVDHVVGSTIEAHRERTRGLYALLSRYEQQYDAHVRRAGRLSFADVQLLLSRGPTREPGVEAEAAAQAGRLYVDYRLDTSLDHWLLDEFQDTSTLQWQAIANLVDEVLQDRSGARSLFYVGDVKQAIHGWRGGDSGLFVRILEHYNRHEERIAQTALTRSWRSAQPIMDAVNLVFGALGASGIAPEVASRFGRHFAPHDTEQKALPGAAVLLEAQPAGEGRKDALADRLACTAQIVKQLDPAGRGLTSAVLVRANEHGKSMVDLLRKEGVPACWNGSFRVADNLYTEALLALVHFAAHPGDTLAHGVLRMTPLSAWVPADPAACGGLVCEVLADIADHGFRHVVAKWTGRLASAAALDPFAARRSEDLLAAALEFDAAGGTAPADFVEFVRSLEVPELPSARGVEVMTMHRAKGLEYDVVFLPDLDGTTLGSSGGLGLEICRRDDTIDRTPQWVLSMPVRSFAAADETLAALVKRVDHDAAYEHLCLLYVAMTRPRQGLYVVVSPPPKTTDTVSLAGLVRSSLSGRHGSAVLRGSSAPEADPAWGGARLLGTVGDPGWLDGRAAARPPAATSAAAEPSAPPGAAADLPSAAPGPAAEPSAPPGAAAELPGAAPGPAAEPSAPPGAAADLPSAVSGAAGQSPSRSGAAGPLLPARQRLRPTTPSGSEATFVAASALFRKRSRAAAERGTIVHLLFEAVEWMDAADPDAIVAGVCPIAEGEEPATSQARSVFLDACRLPVVRDALARPSGRFDLWRERRFEVVLGDEWVSGCFDRVTLEMDAAGAVRSAHLLDFKTDSVASPEEVRDAADRYRPQMAIYRRVLCHITGLAPERVRATLLFVQPGAAVGV